MPCPANILGHLPVIRLIQTGATPYCAVIPLALTQEGSGVSRVLPLARCVRARLRAFVGARHAVPGKHTWLLARHPPRANRRDALTTPSFRAEFRAFCFSRDVCARETQSKNLSSM